MKTKMRMRRGSRSRLEVGGWIMRLLRPSRVCAELLPAEGRASNEGLASSLE